MPLNYREIKRYYDLDARRTCQELREAITAGHIKPEHVSIRGLFESLVPDGRELVSSFDPRTGGSSILLEGAGAVNTTAFSNITGQILYSAVLNAFQDPAFLWPKLVTTIPTVFNGEKIPGIGRIGDAAEAIAEGQEYPLAGLSEEYIETPTTTKRGFITAVTKEAVFFDRTGLIINRASETARWLGVNKEKRVLDVVLGVTDAYVRNGTAITTYGDNSGNHDWDNLAASNALVDWTDIETAELLFDAMVDPNTGEPVVIMPDTIIVPTALKHTARMIVNSTSVERVDNQTNATTFRNRAANPVSDYTILTSQYVKARTSSATTWYLGEPKRAFAYMENWPITVAQAADNSEAELTRDIVARFKVNERGAPTVTEPRRMVKCTA